MDIKSSYNKGEIIDGKLNLNILEGEFIPADSKIKVSYGNISKEFNLSSLIAESAINGQFYTEGAALSGEGLGYGLAGKIENYPLIDFEFVIIENDNSGSKDKRDSEASGETQEPSESGSSEGSNEPEAIAETSESSGSSSSEQTESSETSSSPESSSSESVVESSSEDEPSLTGAVISNSDVLSGKVSKNEPFEYALADGQDASLVEGSVNYNGEILSEDILKFKVKDEGLLVSTDYSIEEEGYGEEYIGNKKKKIEIDLSDFNIVALEDSELLIVLSYNGETITETSEEISVKDSNNNETAVEDPVIFNDSVITNDSIVEVPVVNGSLVIANESTSGNLTGLNETLGNITEMNQTVGNLTNATLIVSNESILVNTTQFTAVIGQPVKWVKTVAFNVNESVSLIIQIPAIAENVTFDKIDLNEYIEIGSLSEEEINLLTQNTSNESLSVGTKDDVENNLVEDVDFFEEFNESLSEEINQTSESLNDSSSLTIGINGGVISGRITSEIELDNKFSWSRFFKKIFGTITGRATEELNESAKEKVKDVIVNLTEDDFGVEVEYYTSAPSATETEINEKFKTLFVSSPNDIHYENVLIFTNISDSLGLRSSQDLIIEWVENDSLISIFEFKDTNNDSNFDYVSWIAPHLSNQTFNIIVITDAIHLDENRTFISNIYNETRELDDIWSEAISSGHYVRVTFEKNLTSENDITIYPRALNGTNISDLSINVYEEGENETLAVFVNLSEFSYNKIYLALLENRTQDVFDLQIIGGNLEFDHIIDPTAQPGGAKILIAQTCNAMDDSATQNNYAGACTGTYPATCAGGDLIDCSDGSTEDRLHSRPNYAGIKITAFNSSITNCASITQVFVCYEWWTTSVAEILTCPIYIDNGGGEVDIGPTCPLPSTGGLNCINVTSSANWACENFFGSSGTRAIVRTEVLNDGGGDETLSQDALFFNVTYNETVPSINFSSPTPANGSMQSSNSIVVNVSASDSSSNISSFIDFDNSLTGWWRMDDLNSSGGVLDYKGKSNGTAVGNAVQNTTSGKLGKSFTFDGNGDYINIPIVAAEVIPSSHMTVSAWVYLRNNKDWNTVVVYNNWVVGKCGFQLEGYNTSGFAFAPNCNQGTPLLWAATTSYSLNNWNHFVGTYDGVTARLYLNGTQVASATNTTYNINFTRDSNTLQISSSGTGALNGSIDDFMLFNRSLSAMEVVALYANTSTKYYWNNFTNLSNGNHTFKAYAQNVFGYVNFTQQSKVLVYNVSGCTTLSTSGVYDQGANIVPSDPLVPCINITSSNVTFNGNGYSIYNLTFNNTGIWVYNVKNVTISGVNVTTNTTRNNRASLEFNRVNNSLILNNTLSGIRGIVLTTSEVVNVTSNTISTNLNRLSDNYGIYLLTSTKNISIYKNTISTKGNSSANYGIYLNAVGNNTISFNNITTNGNQGSNFGVYLVSNANNNVIYSNIISVNGTASNDGIELSTASFNNITSNNITTAGNGTGNYGILISSTSVNNTIYSNIIQTGGTNTNGGIRLQSNSNNNTIISNIINTGGKFGSNYGIYLLTVLNTNVSFNNVTTNGNSTSNYGILVQTTAYNNKIIANNISTNGTGSSYGVYVLTNSTGNLITQNNIRSNGTGGSSYGVYIVTNSSNNTVTFNTISTDGTSDNVGIYVNSFSNNNTVSSNYVNTSGRTSGNYGVYLVTSSWNNIVTANRIRTFGGTSGNNGVYINARSNNNTITYNNISANGNTTGNTGISIQTSFNNTITSNNISTYGLSTTNYGIYLLINSSGNVVSYNTVSTNGTTNNFGAYLVTFAGNNTITFNNITTNGTGASNYGIYLLTNSSNNTVASNIIRTGGTSSNVGVTLYESNENKVISNTINTSGTTSDNYGVYIRGASDNNITSNNIFARGLTTANLGVYLAMQRANLSERNVISSNDIRTLGSNANAGIRLDTASNNTIVLNKINTTGTGTTNYGVYLTTNSSKNTISSNTVSTNGTSSNFGIYFLTNVSGNTVTLNNITTNGTSSSNYGVYLLVNSSFNNITSNIIRTGGTSNGYGVVIQGLSNNNTITSNVLNTSGTTSNNYGVYLQGSTGNNFSSNEIFATGLTGTNLGIYILRQGVNATNNNTISLNRVRTQGTSGNAGIRLDTVHGNTIILNNISTTGSSSGNYGFQFDTNSTANTVTSNTISTNGTSDNYGVYLSTNISGNTFTLNNITSNGTSNNNYGIYLAINSSFNLITLNTIRTGGTDSNIGMRFRGLSNNNTVASNIINTSGTTSSNYGLYVHGSKYNNFSSNNLFTTGLTGSNIGAVIATQIGTGSSTNLSDGNIINLNTISTGGTSSNYGLYLEDAFNSAISLNNISTGGSSSTNYGVYLLANSSSNTLSSNIISTYGTSVNHGVYLLTSSNNIFSINIISANGSSNSNYGLFVNASSNNNLFNFTNISSKLGALSYGIYIDNSSSNTFNNLIVANSTGRALFINKNSTSNNFTNALINNSGAEAIVIETHLGSNSYDNAFNNITITKTVAPFSDLFINTTSGKAANRTILLDTHVTNYSILGSGGSDLVVGSSLYGNIRFLSPVNGSGSNFSRDIYILNNSATVNSSVSGLSKSANVSLYGISTGFMNPVVLKDGVACGTACYNFTSLNTSNVIFNVTSWTNYSIGDDIVINNAPYNGTALIMNSTLGTNKTLDNLNVRTTLLDLENNAMNVTVRWYNKSIQHLALEYNNSYANGSTFIATLAHRNTTKGENWTAGITINDGQTSFTVNSSNLTILNSLPNVTLLTPSNGSTTLNRSTQAFTWAMSDDDGDAIVQDRINISLVASSTCTDPHFDGTDIYEPFESPGQYVFGLNNAHRFRCLIDNGDYYRWSAAASDSSGYGSYAGPFNLSVQAYLDIRMNISSIEFDSLGYLENNDTSDNSPKPIIMVNEGNVLNNVEVKASSIWRSLAATSDRYRIKVANVTTNGISENGSFLWSLSQTTYENIPVGAIEDTLPIITDLNYTDATDSAEVDINVTVPATEGPGYKNSTITFTIILGSGDTYGQLDGF